MLVSPLLVLLLLCGTHADPFVTTGRCRSYCLSKLKGDGGLPCDFNKSCQQCWDMCGMLQRNYDAWSPVCAAGLKYCAAGCQRACSFFSSNLHEHEISTDTKNYPRFELRTHLNSGHISLNWNTLDNLGNEKPIYLLGIVKPDLFTTEWLDQVQEPTYSLRETLVPLSSKVRILTVTSKEIISDQMIPRMDLTSSSLNDLPATISHPRPQLVSMQYSKHNLGLEALIYWKSQASANRYEIVWHVIDEIIEITGHLYSNSNNATITLWPNSLYSIRVHCIAHGGRDCGISEPLLVDTHGIKPTIPTVKSLESDCIQLEVLIGIVAATIVFLIGLSLFYLWIHKKRHDKVKCTTLAQSRSFKIPGLTPQLSPADSNSSYFVFDLPKDELKSPSLV